LPSRVTVCGTLSFWVQRTVVPFFTWITCGWNAKFWIDTFTWAIELWLLAESEEAEERGVEADEVDDVDGADDAERLDAEEPLDGLLLALMLLMLLVLLPLRLLEDIDEPPKSPRRQARNVCWSTTMSRRRAVALFHWNGTLWRMQFSMPASFVVPTEAWLFHQELPERCRAETSGAATRAMHATDRTAGMMSRFEVIERGGKTYEPTDASGRSDEKAASSAAFSWEQPDGLLRTPACR
jgi:hypothetical protein